MDADYLIRAQSEAAAAACAGLASVYRADPNLGVPAWLNTAATEFWKFARDRRLLAPPAAGWVTLLDEHPDAPSASLGVGFSTGLESGQQHKATVRVQRLVRLACPSARGDRRSTRAEGRADAAVTGILHGRVNDDAGGVALFLGGLLRPDGHADESAPDDELLSTFFRAIAQAAADRVMQPISTRRKLCEGLTAAQERVLVLLVEGLSFEGIATRLERSAHTVHDHAMSVYRALGVNSRFELVELWHGRAKPRRRPESREREGGPNERIPSTAGRVSSEPAGR